MSSNEDSEPGLPGLRSIRKALGLTVKSLALEVDVTPKWLSQIEAGADCTQKLLRRLSAYLCCSVADLFASPTPARLAEIRAAYLQRQSDHARAEAADLARAEQEQGAA